jgi:hypothetical protein
VLLLSSITCGLYALWTVYSMANELNAFRRKNDVNPILCLVYVGFFAVPDAVVEAVSSRAWPLARRRAPSSTSCSGGGSS